MNVNLRELYDQNSDFRRYVDRYRIKHGLSVDEALTHRLVQAYAEEKEPEK